ncbi:MAG: division/cell wall cluster transcriptional repressor MraZ [Nitrospinota bacterium]|nr:division/cell wall cluster transcriptional repressor MraZ [Nitrospinota bacterium]
MNGFLGTYYVNLDDKGRVNIPSKFKAVLERENHPNLVVCTMEQYLVVFPQQEWTNNEEKLMDLSAFDTTDRNRLRDFYSSADECDMKSGKILIPSVLRKAAGLNKEVVLVGMSRTFEIWNLGLWGKTYPTGSP